MAENSEPPPTDLLPDCADALWQCARDLCIDRVQVLTQSPLAARCTALCGERLDELASRAQHRAQRRRLIAALAERKQIRDATLTLAGGSRRPLHFLLNATARTAPDGRFLGYAGSVRVWWQPPFLEVYEGELIQTKRRVADLRAKEARLRYESDLLLAGLQVAVESASLQEKCVKIFRLFRPTLAFDAAAVLRRGPGARMVVAAASAPEAVGAPWPESAELRATLAGEPRRVEGAGLAGCARDLPKAFEGIRAALLAPLSVGAETAVLALVARREQQLAAAWPSLTSRLSLVVSKALAEDDQKAAFLTASRLASMGELLATMAHEMNQPLTTISISAGNGRALLRDGAASQEVAGKLERIERQASRATKVLQAVRELAYAERFSRTVETVDLREALDAVVTLARVGLERREIRLTVEVAESGRLVRARSLWIQQIILNLVTNAQDAILERRARDPRWPAGRIHVSSRAGGGHVVLRVSDNGGGIPEDIRERVFDPFFTLKPVGKGSGLGLALCRRLVAEMDGEIMAFNDAEGAVFEIRLAAPAEDTPEPVPRPPARA